MAKLFTKINLRDNRLTRYLRETWYEIRKVSWPTRSEGINLTLMVVVATTFLSIVLSLMDWIFSTGIGLFLQWVG